MQQASIQILLATYNGANYLPEQLRSLLDQTEQDFQILARDDGSTDGTVELLQAFAEQHPGKLELIVDGCSSGSASANFSRLLAASSAPYVMFCDQDDVWLPTKVAKTMAKMKALEKQHGDQLPLMVFSDLVVVDEHLHQKGASFWKYQNLNPKTASHLNRLLVQNVVTGCTMMLNRAVIELGMPVPSQAMMHDWWLALVACAFGKVAYVNESLMLYRQHGANDTGALHWFRELILERNKIRRKHSELPSTAYQQAGAFLMRFATHCSEQQLQLLKWYMAMPSLGPWAKRKIFLRYRLFRVGLLRNLHFLYRV